MKFLLGYDIGSSSVKCALLDAETGICMASAFSPEQEMAMISVQPGWAEQDPEQWWSELILSTRKLRAKWNFDSEDLVAIGISYQMHGLVCLDLQGHPLRPAIIWCDSRAVETGRKAREALGAEFCLNHYLNAPGNFTASKLAWVKDHEPDIFQKVHKVLLPGDYIAYKMTGEICTTVSGLSEGIFWDFSSRSLAGDLLDYYGIREELLPSVKPTFSIQGELSESVAGLLGLKKGTPVSYRAGDQPNNAFSLFVLQPGEVAATAGTSGVIYGVTDRPCPDLRSRVNAFVHVTDQPDRTRIGMLMCINGCGILYSWMRKISGGMGYGQMNRIASDCPPGSDGLLCIPFGNGAERILENKNPGASLLGLDLNRHGQSQMLRAGQEGIGFAFRYGLDILGGIGMQATRIRAGHSNLFLSPVFREIFVHVTGVPLELYDTDGAAGAARGAGVGAGYYATLGDGFQGMRQMAVLEPSAALVARYEGIYEGWKEALNRQPETAYD